MKKNWAIGLWQKDADNYPYYSSKNGHHSFYPMHPTFSPTNPPIIGPIVGPKNVAPVNKVKTTPRSDASNRSKRTPRAFVNGEAPNDSAKNSRIIYIPTFCDGVAPPLNTVSAL